MGALLMLAPLVAVPILAVVGIPQFAPGNLIDPNGSKPASSSRDTRDYSEPRFGDAARHDADDLFAPIDESNSDVEGFDDPLAGRSSRSRGRSSRRDVDDEFGEKAPRSRGQNAPSFEEDSAEEFANNDTNEFHSEEPEEAAPRSSRSRLRSRNSADEFESGSLANDDAEPFNEFADAPRKKTQPRGERYADASGSFGGRTNSRSGAGSRQQFEQQESQESAPENTDGPNPFEAGPIANQSQPAPKRKASAARSRDPHDAPIFQPQESAPEAEEAVAFAPPPEAKSGNTGRRAPQPVVPPTPPEEVTEQETPAAVNESSEEQIAGVDELTWQAATKRLRALGVGKSKQYFTYLEDSNSFLFSCTAIHKQDGKQPQRFEAEAEEPLLAVSQVLEQLEAWQAAAPRRAVARGQE